MPRGIKGSGKAAKKEEKVEKVEKWKPEPVVNVEPPKESEYICSAMMDPYTACGHKKAMHYGGLKGHCNISGCRCQEFK